jgi:PAS domain S-box-containing protein
MALDNQTSCDKSDNIEVGLLRICQTSTNISNLANDVITIFKNQSGCEAVGIRIHNGNDFPYLKALGFPADFIEEERYLCSHNPMGELQVDSKGNPVLACMCGVVLNGRFDPSKPYFTKHGSFWANSTTSLISSFPSSDKQLFSRNRCNQRGYETLALIPIISHGKILGLFQFNDQNRDLFSKEKIEKLELLVDYVALSIANLEAQETLAESESRYHRLADNAVDIIFRYDIFPKQQLSYINTTVESVLGYSPADCYASSNVFVNWIHPDDRQQMVDILQTLQPPDYPLTLRWIGKDGKTHWMETRMVQVLDPNGKIIAVDGITRDINDRKIADDRLVKEKERLAEIINATNVGTYEWNIQTGENIFNERWAEMIGYSLEEISPTTHDTWANFVHPDDLKISEAQLQKHFKGELDYYSCEARMQHKNGNWIWVLDRGKVTEWAGNGKPLIMYGTHQDITDRKLSEEKLIMQQKLLEESQEIAHLGSYVYDIKTGETIWTKETYQIFGLPDDLPPPTGDAYRKLIHPEDLEDENEMFMECIRIGKKMDTTHRIFTNDGELRYIRTIGNPEFDPSGKITGIRGCLQDVTDIKIHEQKILQGSQLLQESQQTAHVGSFIINLETDNNYCTPELFRIFGLKDSLSALTFEDFKSYIHPEDISDFNEAFQKSIQSEDRLNLIYRIIGKDGDLRYLHHIGVPQKNHNGIVIRMASTFQDVTKSYSLENILQSSLLEKEVLLREVHHRVKNNLAAILGLLDMERQNSKDKKDDKLLIDLGNRIKAMSTVHEKLYRSENLARIDFQDYIKSFLSHLRTSFQTDNDLRTTVDIHGVDLSLDTAVPCGLIVNELVTNSLKYAFPAGKPGKGSKKKCEIKITMTKDGPGYKMVISDNGIGLPKNFNWRDSNTLGMRLVRMLGEHQLGGEIELDGSSGTQFTVIFNDRS